MLDFFRLMLEGFVTCLQPINLLYLIPAVIIGLFTGLLPGIGGMTALVVIIPLLYAFNLDPVTAFIIIVGLSFVTFNGGSMTSILFSLPGTDCSVCTIFDGYPLAKKGRPGYAVGAALTSSLAGAFIGCLLTVLLVVIIRPFVLLFTPSEFFVIVLAGLLIIIFLLDRKNILKGVVSASLGLLISFIGYDSFAGMPRFTFGLMSLYDGLTVIIITTGLFALPEFLTLLVEKRMKQKAASNVTAEPNEASVPEPALPAESPPVERATPEDILGAHYFPDMWKGCKATFRHWWLVIKSAVIGAFIGIVPGIGATVSTFLAYGLAKKSSKNPDEFGKGAIEGVIAPESANNATQAGALLPLFTFGIPGNAVGAIMLGALTMYGLTPGREMMTTHLDLVYVMICAGIFANVLATIMLVGASKAIASIARIDVTVLYAPLLVMLAFACFAMQNHFADILFGLVLAFVGILMKKYGYPCGVFLIAFVLGPILESNLFLAINTRGPLFIFQRPIAMAILAVVLLVYLYPVVAGAIRKRKSAVGRNEQ